MSADTGTTAAPAKAAEKSVNVSGSKAQQMIVKRQSAAPEVPPRAGNVAKAPEAPEPGKAAPTPAPTDKEPKAAQPEAEPKPEPAAKPEPKEAEPDDVLSQLSPELKEQIEKRIGKEVSKRKALEDDLNRLKVLVSATPPTIPKLEPSPDNPLADLNTVPELEKRQQEALDAKEWAQSQLDRDDVKEVQYGDRTYNRQQLRDIVRNSDRVATRDIPKRLQFLNTKAQFDRQVQETFGAEPWMQDKTSEAYRGYAQLMADPDVAKRPNASWIAAVQIQGLLDVQRRKAAAGKKAEPEPEPEKAAPKQKAPGSQTAAGAGFAPSREASESRAVKELQGELEKLKGKGQVTGRDAAAYLLKVEQARSKR